MSALFWFFMGSMCTISIFIVRGKWLHKKKFHNPYTEILQHVKDNKLKFKQRLGDVVYFVGYKNMDIIYNLRRNEISGFLNDDCVLASIEKVSHIVKDIISEIESKFYREIYKDVTIMNGIVYSNNIVQPNNHYQESKNHKVGNEETEPMVEFLVEEDVEEDEDFKIDDILHKIKHFGVDSLTKEEIEFIQNIDNW